MSTVEHSQVYLAPAVKVSSYYQCCPLASASKILSVGLYFIYTILGPTCRYISDSELKYIFLAFFKCYLKLTKYFLGIFYLQESCNILESLQNLKTTAHLLPPKCIFLLLKQRLSRSTISREVGNSFIFFLWS